MSAPLIVLLAVLTACAVFCGLLAYGLCRAAAEGDSAASERRAGEVS